ncbi:MAG: proton-conducting transporter membrane subunit, partial [Rickettsiaceae bacterium]|nr:proton-conducting transporter membrane subunit [Rickettsiaceae bacterium]
MLKLYILSLCATLAWPFLKVSRPANALPIVIHGLFNLFLSIVIYIGKIDLTYETIIFTKYQLLLKASNPGWVLIFLILYLWIPSYLYAVNYLKKSGEGRDGRFLFFLNLTFLLGVVLGLAANLLTLYIFYELITLSTLPLVGHNSNNHATKNALMKYSFYLLSSSICLLLPVVIYANSYLGKGLFELEGNIFLRGSNECLVLMILGGIFGIAKTSILPLSNWLPAAMAANYPTSAALHAVVVVNAGIYSLYKYIYEFIGYDNFAKFTEQNTYVLLIPISGIIYAGVNAIFENNIKKILAWSTVAYMNLLVAIIFSPLENLYLFIGLILHSLAKITLFFIFGFLYLAKKYTNLNDLVGMRSSDPFVYLLVSLCSIIISAPPIFLLGDFKKIIKDTAFNIEDKILLITIILSTFFSFIYLGRILCYMGIKSGASKQIFEYDIISFGILCSTFFAAIVILSYLKYLHF